MVDGVDKEAREGRVGWGGMEGTPGDGGGSFCRGRRQRRVMHCGSSCLLS